MDFDERRNSPVFTGALLWQQVKEQSDYCDFTVKQGLWSKRYHECVVCVSPFVQAMIRNTFNENTKGFLELKLGSPESIDMVMMFLYGKSPKLTIENVSVMMHLAEFLLIPKLKAFCADFINNETKVDKENVEKLLHLSSIFDFEIHALTKYIRQHLPELLGGNQLMTITADTLENMFSDATLSYVTADVKFEFIMRWVKRSPEQRKPNLDAIIAGIFLPEVTVNLIKKAKGDKFFEDLQVLNGTDSEVGFLTSYIALQNVYHRALIVSTY
ncbi:kelch-like protein 12 isoform X2 [Mya arenaria]|uniref:kelch-like protein 12 isoform X2 n=1 Tax=Mya arenaria TaxID=6604 RepID=UPI0022E6DD51|nr:kelch-like protein 12 isoform X2 [Mya arenaria]